MGSRRDTVLASSNDSPVIDPAAVSTYREHLVTARQKAQEDFDKTVLSLSGGALAISFAFVKDFIGQDPIIAPLLLMLAWGLWGLSSLFVLVSFYMSHLSLDRAIQQIDKGQYQYRLGGIAARITDILNATGGFMFFFGVCSIAVFVFFNLR
ncbi:hypothetical protein KC957_00125 [Candidatus Saccharibacteria bacterium]|nr:hypothetical protein [Candidatus Saccharibacteria bacterium]